MHIVINIPKKLACEGFERPFTEEEKSILIKAIGNGTPLRKGHGRIIDESEVTGTFTEDNGFIQCFAPTIIEADEKSEE